MYLPTLSFYRLVYSCVLPLFLLFSIILILFVLGTPVWPLRTSPYDATSNVILLAIPLSHFLSHPHIFSLSLSLSLSLELKLTGFFLHSLSSDHPGLDSACSF